MIKRFKLKTDEKIKENVKKKKKIHTLTSLLKYYQCNYISQDDKAISLHKIIDFSFKDRVSDMKHWEAWELNNR